MISFLRPEDVYDIQRTILETESGLQACAPFEDVSQRLGGPLGRVENLVSFGGETDIYEVAGMYVEAIAMGHCFPDGNKRTSLVSAITFLELHEILIREEELLADVVESLVKREISRQDVAQVFRFLTIY